MPTGFQSRILAERTAALACRGAAAGPDLLPPRLVCIAANRHLALPVDMVATIRRFQCHPVPLVRSRAAGTMLGLAVIGSSLVSVLELARLLPPGSVADQPSGSGGKMLLMRSAVPAVALRVDRVVGVLGLAAAAEPGLGLMPGDAHAAEPPPLVLLVEPGAIMAAIAALDA